MKKIIIFGLVFFIFNFVSLTFVKQSFAQKNDTHINVKKGLNDDFITLSANGAEVRLECAEWQCTKQAEDNCWCDPNWIEYTQRSETNICGDFKNGQTRKNSTSLDHNKNCIARVGLVSDWKAITECYWKEGDVGSASYRKCTYKCVEQKCIGWKLPADKLLGLMPDIGLANIDPNLIEY